MFKIHQRVLPVGRFFIYMTTKFVGIYVNIYGKYYIQNFCLKMYISLYLKCQFDNFINKFRRSRLHPNVTAV